jgi:hypothetical protein
MTDRSELVVRVARRMDVKANKLVRDVRSIGPIQRREAIARAAIIETLEAMREYADAPVSGFNGHFKSADSFIQIFARVHGIALEESGE